MKIEGKVALVTGGASGLGAACGLMIAAAGGSVVVVDWNAEAGQKLAGELGPRARFAHADVGDAAQVETAVQTATREFGRLDITINCAGIGLAERVLGKAGPASLESFSKVIRVNLIGTFNVIRLAAAAMARNEPREGGERGVIICTSSIAAFDGQIGQAAYSASKGGIVSMTLPLARDLSRNGIRVMTIAPGVFDTPLLAGLPAEATAALAAGVPFPQRLGNPDEYAHLARHIIENSYLNGEVIRLDGALRMAPK